MLLVRAFLQRFTFPYGATAMPSENETDAACYNSLINHRYGKPRADL
jgi:hypothetical protein